MRFTVTVEIEADDEDSAQEIRDEIAGAAEDFYESNRTASASVGDIEEME